MKRKGERYVSERVGGCVSRRLRCGATLLQDLNFGSSFCFFAMLVMPGTGDTQGSGACPSGRVGDAG